MAMDIPVGLTSLELDGVVHGGAGAPSVDRRLTQRTHVVCLCRRRRPRAEPASLVSPPTACSTRGATCSGPVGRSPRSWACPRVLYSPMTHHPHPSQGLALQHTYALAAFSRWLRGHSAALRFAIRGRGQAIRSGPGSVRAVPLPGWLMSGPGGRGGGARCDGMPRIRGRGALRGVRAPR